MPNTRPEPKVCPAIEQKRREMFCRDCERFSRTKLISSIGWCDEQRTLVTEDMICPLFTRRADAND